jgi:hypothetical protein
MGVVEVLSLLWLHNMTAIKRYMWIFPLIYLSTLKEYVILSWLYLPDDVKLSIYHSGVFIKVKKCSLAVKNNFYIINILYGQHVSNRYWVINVRARWWFNSESKMYNNKRRVGLVKTILFSSWWWFPCKLKHVGRGSLILKIFINSRIFHALNIVWAINCLIITHISGFVFM